MRTAWAFAILVLVFIILRLGTLLTCVECVSQYEYEELYPGTIAKELIEGLKVPFWNYQQHAYGGGSLLIGLMVAPLFLLLGPNLFALKLAPLLFSLATLILSFFFFKRFFDKKTALLVCSFLVLPPPVVTALSLTTSSPHTESILFSAMMLFCFYRFFYGVKDRTAFLILFGLVGGLGFWFDPLTLITLATCLASWLLLDRPSFLSLKLGVFLASFGLTGLLPSVPYQLAHQRGLLQWLWNAFFWKKDLLMLDKLQSLPPRIGTLIFETLPSLFFFPSFSILSGTLLTALYGLVVFFLILPFFWRGVRKLENRKFLPFLLYPFCFLITLSAAHYPVSYFPLPQFAHLGYFSPFYYFVFSLLALALRHKKRPAFFLWFFMGLGLIGQGSLLFREPWGRGFQYKGYSYMELGRTWGAFSLLYPFPQKLREFQRIADQYAESDRRFFYWGLATGMDAQMDSKMLWDAKRVVEAIDRIPSSYQLYFFDGWGSNLCRRTEGNLDDGNSALTFKNKIIELSKSLSRETLPYFYYGLVTRYPVHLPDQREVDCLGYMQERDFPQPSLFHFYVGRSLYFSLEPGERKEVPADIWNSLGRKEKGWVWRGLGAMAGAFSALRMNVANFNPLWINIPPEDRNDFYWGVGWGVIERMVEDPIRAFDMLRRLPTEAQKAAQEGFSEFERWYAIAPGDESNTRFEFHELSPRVK